MAYSACDPGNYFVIPGSPVEAWKADSLMDSYKDNILRNYASDVFTIAVVGSQLLYRGLWLEHALVLKALYPVFEDFGLSSSHLKIFVLAGESTSNYSRVVEVHHLMSLCSPNLNFVLIIAILSYYLIFLF